MDALENDYTKMWIKDGILYCVYKPGLEVNLKIAEICVKERIKLSNGNTYPMFGDISHIKKTDREAREYLSKGDGIRFLSAGAFLIKTQVEKYTGNFWMRINKPPLPVKLFTVESEAIEWLKNYRITNLN